MMFCGFPCRIRRMAGSLLRVSTHHLLRAARKRGDRPRALPQVPFGFDPEEIETKSKEVPKSSGKIDGRNGAVPEVSNESPRSMNSTLIHARNLPSRLNPIVLM